MSSPDTVSKFTESQWVHARSMVGYHDHVSTVSSQRDCVSQSTLSHYNLANRCGHHPHLTVVHSARQDMCQVTLYSKTYHPNSCQISRVEFFVLATEV